MTRAETPPARGWMRSSWVPGTRVSRRRANFGASALSGKGLFLGKEVSFQNGVFVGVVPEGVAVRIAVKEDILAEMTFSRHADFFEDAPGGDVFGVAVGDDPMNAEVFKAVPDEGGSRFGGIPLILAGGVEDVAEFPGEEFFRFVGTEV